MTNINRTGGSGERLAEMHADPARFIRDFYEGISHAILSNDSDADVVDRFHTPDMVQVADGVTMDRDRLIAHMRPVRKGLSRSRVEVHEAIAADDAVAARLTIHAELNRQVIVTDAHFFGRFAVDGRLRSAHQFTKTRKQATA